MHWVRAVGEGGGRNGGVGGGDGGGHAGGRARKWRAAFLLGLIYACAAGSDRAVVPRCVQGVGSACHDRVSVPHRHSQTVDPLIMSSSSSTAGRLSHTCCKDRGLHRGKSMIMMRLRGAGDVADQIQEKEDVFGDIPDGGHHRGDNVAPPSQPRPNSPSSTTSTTTRTTTLTSATPAVGVAVHDQPQSASSQSCPPRAPPSPPHHQLPHSLAAAASSTGTLPPPSPPPPHPHPTLSPTSNSSLASSQSSAGPLCAQPKQKQETRDWRDRSRAHGRVWDGGEEGVGKRGRRASSEGERDVFGPMFGPKRARGRPRRHGKVASRKDLLSMQLGIDWRNATIVAEGKNVSLTGQLDQTTLWRLKSRLPVQINGTAIVLDRRGNSTCLASRPVNSKLQKLSEGVRVRNPRLLKRVCVSPPPDPGGGWMLEEHRHADEWQTESEDGSEDEGGGSPAVSGDDDDDDDDDDDEGEEGERERVPMEEATELMRSNQAASRQWGIVSGRGIPPVDGPDEGEMYSVLMHAGFKTVIELKHDSPGWVRFKRPYPNGTVEYIYSSGRVEIIKAPFNELRAPKLHKRLFKGLSGQQGKSKGKSKCVPKGFCISTTLTEGALGHWMCQSHLEGTDSQIFCFSNVMLGSQLYLTGDGFVFIGNDDRGYWVSGSELPGKHVDADSAKRILMTGAGRPGLVPHEDDQLLHHQADEDEARLPVASPPLEDAMDSIMSRSLSEQLHGRSMDGHIAMSRKPQDILQ